MQEWKRGSAGALTACHAERRKHNQPAQQCTRYGVETETIEQMMLLVKLVGGCVRLGEPRGLGYFPTNLAPREEVEGHV